MINFADLRNSEQDLNLDKNSRQKHDYTCELELKSLLIREKNSKLELQNNSIRTNKRINELINLFVKLNTDKFQKSLNSKKVKNLQNKIKDTIIKRSELVSIDRFSHERFGEIILLMIKNILKKPNFSGYTWKEDFYSDATYRVLKYLHNFNHTKTSEKTGQSVNAFSYISQIIHNSIVYIINTNNQEIDITDKLSQTEGEELGIEKVKTLDKTSISEKINEKFIIQKQDLSNTSLFNLLSEFVESSNYDKDFNYTFEYPKEYLITIDEFAKLRDILKGNISIIKAKK
jgi:hypothetical protein